jgi:hypothetical protein
MVKVPNGPVFDVLQVLASTTGAGAVEVLCLVEN